MGDIEMIIQKAVTLKRLTLPETAALLSANDPDALDKIHRAAARIKDTIYGKRVVIFAPLYISNLCSNGCLYCGFNTLNKTAKRKALGREEIISETRTLLKCGHKRVLAVAGEYAPKGEDQAEYYASAVRAIYEASHGPHRIKRVNINCAPLSVYGFKKLKAAGIGTYQLFQETYHEETYRTVHPKGPKSDPDNRIDAIDRAFQAGIDDVGIGALYGLYDHKFETLAMLSHVEHLEKKFGVGPHTISVPRLQTADGTSFADKSKHRVSDQDFKKIVSVLRLAVPYTGIILSTRESQAMRDELVTLGVSQISAGSNTAPGGYSEDAGGEKETPQFILNDHRSLNEVCGALIKNGMVPSFCAACYRKERTGESFMALAKPGDIKCACDINGLVTLKEYLSDFAPEDIKKCGQTLIEKERIGLDPETQKRLSSILKDIDAGARDIYV